MKTVAAVNASNNCKRNFKTKYAIRSHINKKLIDKIIICTAKKVILNRFSACCLRLTLKSMIHKTKGIVLRTVKYGETSVIVSIYTELFGLQSYIINGIRTSSKKKGSAKGNLFQPAAIL